MTCKSAHVTLYLEDVTVRSSPPLFHAGVVSLLTHSAGWFLYYLPHIHHIPGNVEEINTITQSKIGTVILMICCHLLDWSVNAPAACWIKSNYKYNFILCLRSFAASAPMGKKKKRHVLSLQPHCLSLYIRSPRAGAQSKRMCSVASVRHPEGMNTNSYRTSQRLNSIDMNNIYRLTASTQSGRFTLNSLM